MKHYKFEARIEASEGGGAHVLFPYDVQKEFGTKGRVAVEAKIDGVPYAGSLSKYGEPLHRLHILKAIREQTGKGPGAVVEVELWKDKRVRAVEAPPELVRAMQREGVEEVFKRLSYSHQKEYCSWISDAKKEETRSKRVDKAVQMLKANDLD